MKRYVEGENRFQSTLFPVNSSLKGTRAPGR